MNGRRRAAGAAKIGLLAGGLLAAGVLGHVAGCGSAGSRPRAIPPGAVVSPAERLARAWELAEAAEEAREKGDAAASLRLYGEAAEYAPNVAPILHNLGYAWYEMGNRLDAVRAFVRAAEAEPGDPRHYTAVGHVYREAFWAEQALFYYERALDIDPNHLEALIGAIGAAEALGRAEEIDLDRVRRAQLVATDPELREYLARRALLLAGRIERERAEARREGL